MRSKRETRKNPPPPGGGSGGGGASRAAANNAPPPARVDANLNLSLRAQLRAAKAAAAEAAAAAPGGGTGKPKPALRTKFRRNKDDEAVVEAWTAKQRRKAEERKRMPDGKYVVGPAPLCFIDGYNIIGWWPQLKKRRDAGDMDGARRRLMGYVEEFATVRGWECVVVFDANNTGTFGVEWVDSEAGRRGRERGERYVPVRLSVWLFLDLGLGSLSLVAGC